MLTDPLIIESPIVIRPNGGLCNLLRVVFSWLMYARSINKKLVVLWELTDHCTGFFLDYFHPIEDVTFIINDFEKYKNTKIGVDMHGDHSLWNIADPTFIKNDFKEYKNTKIDYIGVNCHRDYSQRNMFIYKDLKLLPYIVDIIKNKIEEMISNSRDDKSYMAVHIRRTDHISYALQYGHFTTDQEFIDFIKNNNDVYSSLYIATDNVETHNKFNEMFHDKYHINKFIDFDKDVCRQTSLLDSIIDIYMCINADVFKGSVLSSFSELIDHMRHHNKQCLE